MMHRIRGWIYALGFRPKRGSIFYSPSRHMSEAWIPYAENFLLSMFETQKEFTKMTEIKPDKDKVVVHDTKIGDLIAIEDFIFRVKGLTLGYNEAPYADIASIVEEIADGTFSTNQNLTQAEPVNRPYSIGQDSQNRSDGKTVMLIVGSCEEYFQALGVGWEGAQLLHWCFDLDKSKERIVGNVDERIVGNVDFSTYAKVYLTYEAVQYIDFDEMARDAQQYGFECQLIPLGPPRG